LFIVNLAQKSN